MSELTLESLAKRIEALETARRWPDTERILMSGSCDREIVNQGLRNGEIGYFFNKPSDPKEILREIQERAARAHARRVGARPA